MRKAIATTALGAPAVANAETATPAPTASTTEQVTETERVTTTEKDRTGLWGLLGLAGLAGLAGLRKRPEQHAVVRHEPTRSTATTQPTHRVDHTNTTTGTGTTATGNTARTDFGSDSLTDRKLGDDLGRDVRRDI